MAQWKPGLSWMNSPAVNSVFHPHPGLELDISVCALRRLVALEMYQHQFQVSDSFWFQCPSGISFLHGQMTRGNPLKYLKYLIETQFLMTFEQCVYSVSGVGPAGPAGPAGSSEMLMLANALDTPFEIYERKTDDQSELVLNCSITKNIFDKEMISEPPIRLLVSTTANLSAHYDVLVPLGTVVDIVDHKRALAAEMVKGLALHAVATWIRVQQKPRPEK